VCLLEIIIHVIDFGGLTATFSATTNLATVAFQKTRIVICLHLEGPLDANTPASGVPFSSERAFLGHSTWPQHSTSLQSSPPSQSRNHKVLLLPRVPPSFFINRGKPASSSTSHPPPLSLHLSLSLFLNIYIYICIYLSLSLSLYTYMYIHVQHRPMHTNTGQHRPGQADTGQCRPTQTSTGQHTDQHTG
jgi:hypothetical protein